MPLAELAPPWAHDLVELGEPEGHEEEAGLVDVAVVAVDDVDLGLVVVEAAPEPVGGHRAAGAAAEDDDLRAPHNATPCRGSELRVPSAHRARRARQSSSTLAWIASTTVAFSARRRCAKRPWSASQSATGTTGSGA